MFYPPPPADRTKVRRTFTVALIATASMVTFMACQKESDLPGNPTQRTENDYEPRIRAFVERTTDTASRDDAPLSADSAEWYIEAALNFSNANISIPYNNSHVDSLTYRLPLTAGEVNAADAAAAYNSLTTAIANHNHEGQSHVVIVDITSERTADEMLLTAACAVGSDYGKALNTTYGPNDYWMWWCMGNCNCGPNPNAGIGADKRIEQRINSELAAMGNGVYMVSIETWKIRLSDDLPSKTLGYYNFPVAGAPYGYRTYHCAGTGASTCLSPANMAFFTQGTWDVMNLIKQQYCPTKLPQYCTVLGNMAMCCAEYFHEATYRYGIIPSGPKS